MKFLVILAMIAASPALAEENACHQKTITVCPTKKPHPKPKPKPAPVEAKKECVQNVNVVVNVPACPAPKTVVKIVERAPAPAPVADTPVRAGPTFGIGMRGAVGTMVVAQPHVFGLVGVRGRWFPARLGLELDTQFYWGHSAQLMVYPIQGPLSWHLDLGMLWHGHDGFGAQDVPRKWDLTAGTGIEWNFTRNVSLTADWRVGIPNPVTMHKYDRVDANGRYLNVGNTIGNSFGGSQLLLGLMVHTW